MAGLATYREPQAALFRALVQQAKEGERAYYERAKATPENWETGQLLPLKRNRVTGDYDWAIPRGLADMFNAAQAPGKAAAGLYDLTVGPDGRVSYAGMAEDAAGLASSLTLGAGAIPGQGLGMGFRVFHGSPHDFDKFSLEHIGKGEGAQAYGRGLYFAENPSVAQNYQAQLAKSKIVIGDTTYDPAELSEQLWQSSGNQSPEFLRGIMDAVNEKTDGITPKAPDDLSGWTGYGPMAQREGYAYAAEKLKGAEASAGRLYEADIDAEPEDFLDWDKPLSEQSEKVRKALQDAGIVDFDANTSSAGAVPKYSSVGAWLGEQLYRKLADKHFTKRGVISSEGHRLAAGDVSKLLNEIGIRGIRYLDQGSRGKGDGSRNYVVFDDNLISILSKR